MNAVELVEDYFVSPPGNVPLQEVSNLDLRKVNEWDLAAMQDTSKKKLFKWMENFMQYQIRLGV